MSFESDREITSGAWRAAIGAQPQSCSWEAAFLAQPADELYEERLEQIRQLTCDQEAALAALWRDAASSGVEPLPWEQLLETARLLGE